VGNQNPSRETTPVLRLHSDVMGGLNWWGLCT